MKEFARRHIVVVLALAFACMMLLTMVIGITSAETPMISPDVALEKCMKLMTERKMGYINTDDEMLADAQLTKKLAIIVDYMEKNREEPLNDIDNGIVSLSICCKEYLDIVEEEGRIFTSMDWKINLFHTQTVDYRNRKVSPVNSVYAGADTKEEIAESMDKDFEILYDPENNILHVYRNGSTEEATLSDIFYKLHDESMTLLYRESPDVWVLKTTIYVEPGMRLVIKNPKPTTYMWLKLANCGNSPSRIIVSGELVLDAIRVSSWDSVKGTFIIDATSPRGEIKFDGGKGLIQHCRIEHLGYASASRQTHGITLVNCTDVKIYDNTIIGGFQGINVQHSSGVVVRGNVIEKPFDTGILMENESFDCDLISNIINASGRHGIMVFDRCKNSRITLNTLSNNFGHGIKVFKWCHGLDINQNIAKDNMGKAIAVFACDDIEIKENIAINGTGIFVAYKSSGCDISSNRLTNMTTGIALIGTTLAPSTISESIDISYDEFEIYSEYNIEDSMYGDVTYCTVDKNDVRVCQNEGIKLYSAHHNSANHNTITGSDKFGIHLIGSWYNTFGENEIDYVGKAKYSAIDNSYKNTLMKNGIKYTLTDGGCVVRVVDVNEDGRVNLNELGLMLEYIFESVTGWF